MKSYKSLVALLGFVIAVLLVPPPVMAQSQLEEVLVTARRLEESIQDAPITVNVMTAAQLEEAGVTQTADYIQLIPNVSLAESQTAGTSFLTVRGLSRVRNGELPVAVVVDDVLIVNARQFTGQVFDVQQIEFVKGPQGGIYGRNASNGAVIITTKEPSTEKSEGYTKLSYGTAKEIGVEGSFSGPLSDTLAFRLSGRILERDGYFTNITLDDELDPLSDRTLRARLMWKPSDTVRVDLKAETSKHEGKGIGFHGPGFIAFNPLVGTELGFTQDQLTEQGANLVGLNYTANNPDRGTRDTSGLSLKVDASFSRVDLKSVTTFNELTTSSVADAGPYLSVLTEGTQHSFVDVDSWSQEIRLSSNSDGALSWQFGAYYLSWKRLRSTLTGTDKGQGIKRVTTVPEDETSTNPTNVAPGGFLSFVEDSFDIAFFGSLDWNATDKLVLSFAARYDSETREQAVNEYNTAGRLYKMANAMGVKLPYANVACDAEMAGQMEGVNCGQYATFTALLANTELQSPVNKRKYSLFQPKLSVAYSASDAVNVYGSWGIGYRAGQFNYPGIDTISPTARESIDQEENSTFEVGVKVERDTLRFNVAFFTSTVKNTQYFPFNFAAFTQVFEDIDRAEISGFEVEAYWKPVENLDLYIGYGHTSSEITAYSEYDMTAADGTMSNAVIGNDLPYVPKQTFNAGAQYEWKLGNNLALSARADYEIRGRQFWTPQNGTPRDALNLINLRLGLSGEKWSTSLYVNNLTNKTYNSEVVGPFLFLHPAPPRVVRVDVRYEF